MKRAKSKWINPDFDDNGPICRSSSSPEELKNLSSLGPRDPRGSSLDETLFKSKKRSRPDQDLELWSEKHRPKTTSDLAVHPKKVEELERWLRSPKVQNNVLFLVGPAGSGKTATIRILAKKLGFEIQEWTNPMSDDFGDVGDGVDVREGQGQKFRRFLSRAHRYRGLSGSKKLVLIEEIPPLCLRDPEMLHKAVKMFKTSEFPLVVIYSESKRNDSQIRKLFPPQVVAEMTQITFNAVSTTNLVKTLTAVSMVESSRGVRSFQIPDKSSLTSLAAGVNGDVRAAINALQFACLNDKCPDYKRDFEGYTTLVSSGTKKKEVKKAKVAAVGGKDPSIDLFHAIGKVLYAKRTDRSENLLSGKVKKVERNELSFNPDELLDNLPMTEESFNSFLHQSYSDFFKDIHEGSEAIECLSQADLFFREWTATGKVSMSEYGGQVGVRGLCYHNTDPQKSGSLRTFGKPEWYSVISKSRTNLSLITRPFLERGLSTVEIITSMAPLIAKSFSLENQPPGFTEAVSFFQNNKEKFKITEDVVDNDHVDHEDVEFLVEDFD